MSEHTPKAPRGVSSRCPECGSPTLGQRWLKRDAPAFVEVYRCLSVYRWGEEAQAILRCEDYSAGASVWDEWLAFSESIPPQPPIEHLSELTEEQYGDGQGFATGELVETRIPLAPSRGRAQTIATRPGEPPAPLGGGPPSPALQAGLAAAWREWLNELTECLVTPGKGRAARTGSRRGGDDPGGGPGGRGGGR